MISPQTALHDPVFRAYLLIVPVSLGLGGAILGFLHWGLRMELGSIWKTYRSWLVMASIGLLVVFAGRVPVIIGVTLLSIFGFKEFARSSGLYRDWWMTGAVYAGIIAVGIASWAPGGEGPGAGSYGCFMAVPVFAIALILLFAARWNVPQLVTRMKPSRTAINAITRLLVATVLACLR